MTKVVREMDHLNHRKLNKGERVAEGRLVLVDWVDDGERFLSDADHPRYRDVLHVAYYFNESSEDGLAEYLGPDDNGIEPVFERCSVEDARHIATLAKNDMWCGIDLAEDSDHDRCFSRYYMGEPLLGSYHFAVTDDRSRVEIVPASDDSANGIWTLAEVKAQGASWTQVAAVAARMRAAIRLHRAGL